MKFLKSREIYDKFYHKINRKSTILELLMYGNKIKGMRIFGSASVAEEEMPWFNFGFLTVFGSGDI